jgi:ABC-type sulfate transport system substrate-binding protein
LGLSCWWCLSALAADKIELLNASYDVSRELFAQFNPAFQSQWRAQGLQVIYPSLSLQADFPVAVVDAVVDRRGTRAAAEAYLHYLYSDAGQEILAQNYNRVRNEAVLARHRAQFPAVRLTSVDKAFGSWEAVNKAK